MALLGDLLFPDPNTREYFTDEMQGRLAVTTDYDSMTITMQGRAREFERIIEILRNALVTHAIDARKCRSRRGTAESKSSRKPVFCPPAVADRAIAARLFGDFPYGRPSAALLSRLSELNGRI